MLTEGASRPSHVKWLLPSTHSPLPAVRPQPQQQIRHYQLSGQLLASRQRRLRQQPRASQDRPFACWGRADNAAASGETMESVTAYVRRPRPRKSGQSLPATVEQCGRVCASASPPAAATPLLLRLPPQLRNRLLLPLLPRHLHPQWLLKHQPVQTSLNCPSSVRLWKKEQSFHAWRISETKLKKATSSSK